MSWPMTGVSGDAVDDGTAVDTGEAAEDAGTDAFGATACAAASGDRISERSMTGGTRHGKLTMRAFKSPSRYPCGHGSDSSS